MRMRTHTGGFLGDARFWCLAERAMLFRRNGFAAIPLVGKRFLGDAGVKHEHTIAFDGEDVVSDEKDERTSFGDVPIPHSPWELSYGSQY